MSIVYRPGYMEDNFAAFQVFLLAIDDLSRRTGMSNDPPPNAEQVEAHWQERRSLYEHLTRTAEFFWVAEENGKIVGYSRSRRYGHVRELTEFFVSPQVQSRGIGRELLARAFPRDDTPLRVIIAAPELRAQVLYMRSGVYARHTIFYWSRKATRVEVVSDLTFEPVTDSPETLATCAAIDQEILGFRRDEDHKWFLAEKQGWLYKRGETIVGYGYTGANPGPFALHDPKDFAAVLAHAENQAVEQGRNEFYLTVHSTNSHVIDYLVAQGFRASPFIASLMSNEPFGRFENYINTDPPFFL